MTIQVNAGANVVAPPTFLVKRGKKLNVSIAAGLLGAPSAAPTDRVLVVQLLKKPKRGKLKLQADGSFVYRAPATAGKFTFRYRIMDSSSGTFIDLQATIRVTV